MANGHGGKRKNAGRPKGAANLVPRELKEMILNTLHQAGGEDYLLKVANEDHKTFCGLLGRVLPMTVAGDPEDPLAVVTTIKLAGVSSDDRND